MRASSRSHLLALLAGVAAVYLLLAWPGADRRGVIAEEITPYLPHYPLVLASADDRGVVPLPPHDHAITEGWVSTAQWPNLAYVTPTRTWPLLIKGHQSALGSYYGLAAAPLLGDGIAGIRRSSVLLGLGLVLLTFALGRRLGLAPRFAAAAALACAASPGLLFFARTGYGFELASRVAMLVALVLAALPSTFGWRRAAAIGLAVATAILCRATIAATLLPALLLLFVHPARRSGLRRPALALAIGAALPLAFVALVQATIPLHAGTAPAAKLPFADLADRTATAPATLAAQLAWVADPDSLLLPLITNVAASPLLPLAFGTAILLLALARWWRARAGDPECLFVAAALGNALFGAWLYGDPQQFQLGMALEPLFILAVAAQLQSLHSARPRLAAVVLALVLGVRLWQCAGLRSAEVVANDNPMLSAAAQRELIDALLARDPAPHSIITTTYNHVGMLEAWSVHSPLVPVHAYRALRRGRGGDDRLVAAWTAILAAYPARFIVLTTGRNMFDGPFTDNLAVQSALTQALPRVQRRIASRHEFSCESGSSCFALIELSP